MTGATWKPPYAKDCKIIRGKKSWLVRTGHGTEHADSEAFAIILYSASIKTLPGFMVGRKPT